MMADSRHGDDDKALRQAAQEDDARSDLAAMLAASRELGPDMDRALVDSYMTRHKDANKPTPAAQPPAPAAVRSHRSELVAAIVMAGTLAAYCIVLWQTQGRMFWLIFPLMGWLGGLGFWGSEHRSERHAARHEYRQQQRALREEYRARRYSAGERPWEWADADRDHRDDRDNGDDHRAPGRASADSFPQSPPTYHV